MPKLLLIILIGWITSLPSFSQTSFRIQAVDLVKEGDLYLSQGDWDKALFAYTNAIQVDVTYAEAYMKRGRLYEMTTHTTEASLDYYQAMLLNPYVDIYYNDKTLLKLIQSNYYGAYNDITKKIELNPESDEFAENQYDLFVQLDLYHDYFGDSINQLQVTDLHKIILTTLDAGDLSDASILVDSALAINSQDYVAIDFLGVIRLLESDLEGAELSFNKALEINDRYFPSYYHRAVTYRYLGDKEKAKEDINMALEIHDSEDAYFKRALLNKEDGDLDEALKDYNQAISMDEDFDRAVYNRAFTNKILGNYEAALTDIDELIKEDPTNHELYDLKGSVHMLYGNLDEALVCLNQSISYDNTCASCYYHRGLTYILLQIPIKGCEDLQRSLDLDLPAASVIFDNFCGF